MRHQVNVPLLRPATDRDAEGISEVLQDLVQAGKRRKDSNAGFALTHYIRHPDQISCTVACDEDGCILGFQSLKLAVKNNPYGAPVGWGVIGTHIRTSAARRGVGRALFRETMAVARAADLPAIDATISVSNAEGLAYYGAMGFSEYRRQPGAISKCFET